MEQLKPPPYLNLEGNLAENFREWLEGYQIYATATGLEGKPGKVQVATFLHIAGVEARRVYNTFVIDDGDKDSIDVLQTKFKDYCEPRKNVTYTRHIFFTRNQSPYEPIDSYVTDLKNKAKPCEFGDLMDGLIRDRIVCGISNEPCRARLLRETNLTLVKAIDICRAQELSVKQLKSLKSDEHSPSVAAVKTSSSKQGYSQTKPKIKQKHYKPSKPAPVDSCRNCGRVHEPKACPAYGQNCNYCQKRNHFATCCLSKKKHARKVHTVELPESDEEFFIGSLHIDTIGIHEWTETIVINNSHVTFQLDTGAQANILPKSTYDNLNITNNPLSETKVKLVTYSGNKIVPVGTTILDCIARDNSHKLKFYIVDAKVKPILGNTACTQIGSIIRVHTVEPSLSKDSILDEYGDVFNDLGCLPGQHTITIDPTVPPVVHPPRKVPIAIKQQVCDELQRMESMGVIVKQDEPTDWVHSMVTVRKGNKLRICIDPKDLNRAIKREHFHLETIEEIAERLPTAKYFSRFDATHGFWQIKLDEESSKLLTFNTPIGRYRFLRLPFGTCSSSEVFSKAIRDMFADIPGVECIVDDILVWGETEREHDARVRRVLDRCREKNFKLNRNKFEVRVPEVKYVGHVITSNGLKVDPEKVRAITEMPPPVDVQGVKRFLGAVQYCAKFIPNLSDVSEPLRQLCKSDIQWHWDSPQVTSFEKLKTLVSSTPVLTYYDVTKPVTLSADSSSTGLGAVLLQDQHPVAYGSRALTDAQTRYAQIDREMLAIVYGCEKFHHYIYGRHVRVETDHKPLVAIYQKPLYRATPRLQRMLLRLQRYDLELVYVPGKEMYISDTLSRAYLNESTETLVDNELDVNILEAHLPVSPSKLQELKQATANDEILQKLVRVVVSGWPEERSRTEESVRQFWNYRDEITVIDGLLYKGQRLIIPKSARSAMLSKLHESHLGVVKTKQRARDILFWPNINSDIEQMVRSCSVCNEFSKSNPKEPLIPHEMPSRPWEKVAVDLFEFKGLQYLLCVDFYSKYPEIVLLSSTSSANTITALKSIFARHGIPSEAVSDNASNFTSGTFKKFVNDWNFVHTTSSPRFPQSNGQAERCVQTVKTLLKKAEKSDGDVYISLLEYRACPIDGIGLSPSQLLMQRQLRTKLPITAQLLKPNTTADSHKTQLVARQTLQKFHHDKQSHELPKLKSGQIVRMKDTASNLWVPAVVNGEHSERSYFVSTGNKHYRRNRRHLRQTREMGLPPVEPDIYPFDIRDHDHGDAVAPPPAMAIPPPPAAPAAPPDEPPPPAGGQPVPPTPPGTTTRSGRLSRKPRHLTEYFV